MLRTDVKLASALDSLESAKALLTRTSYEVPYGRAFEKVRCGCMCTRAMRAESMLCSSFCLMQVARLGLRLDKDAYRV